MNATLTPGDISDIQGIILRGYQQLQGARFMLLRVVDQVRAKAWLAGLKLTNATVAARKHAADGPFLNMALSHQGLVELKVDDKLIDDFPRDFVEGPGTPERARILGDVDASAKEYWQWGKDDSLPHVVLMIYAKDDPSVAAEHDRLLAEAEAAGLARIRTLDTILLNGRKEHFGFRDGISQPVVAGSRDTDAGKNTIPPGEIFLGHRNAFDSITHSPHTSAKFDFGKNGSYMVLRTLSQDVRGFWEFCHAQASAWAMEPVTLASKMFGRWPSGASLVLHPESDPGPKPEFENEDRFGFNEIDLEGTRCPFGAHIRRANPRDWNLAPSTEESIAVANRHRMIRRARAFGPPAFNPLNPWDLVKRLHQEWSEAERGLHFICFQGNIERQFEFVQQQWCNNPNFAGLHLESDPITGSHQISAAGSERPVFTVPGAPVRHRAVGVTRYVQVRGSAYLFMPSLSAVRSLGNGA